MVEKRVGEEVGIEAITMALRKSDSFFQKNSPSLFECFSEVRIVLRTGLVLMRFSRTDELHKKLIEFQKKIDWTSGEQVWLIQQSDEISVIVPLRREEELVSLAGKEAILSKYHDAALVTLLFQEKFLDTVGVIACIGNQFSDVGVSIIEMFSSHAKVSVLFDESKSPLVYEKLSKAIKTSGEIANLKGQGQPVSILL